MPLLRLARPLEGRMPLGNSVLPCRQPGHVVKFCPIRLQSKIGHKDKRGPIDKKHSEGTKNGVLVQESGIGGLRYARTNSMQRRINLSKDMILELVEGKEPCLRRGVNSSARRGKRQRD